MPDFIRKIDLTGGEIDVHLSKLEITPQSPMTRKSGFSLLKLLVALALLAVIGAGLANAMRLGTQVYSRAQALGDGSVEVAARSQLRRLLERATPLNLLTPFPKEFRGTDNALSFVTLSPLGFARDAAGLRVSIAMEGDELGATITAFDDDGRELSQHSAKLLSGAAEVTFRYFTNGEWATEWSDTSQLPELVQIAVTGKTEPFWPEFTVELIHSD